MKTRFALFGMVSVLTIFNLTNCTCSKSPKTYVKIDGSSTVFPITEAVAEEFQKEFRSRVTVGVSGTGGGFQKFCRGKIDITGASRHIKPSERKMCGENSIAFEEVPVAYDGIAVVVNPKNTWVDYLTIAELKKMWEPQAQGEIKRWSQVRAGWPDKPLHLFGPGVDSGTYDYFTKVVVGKEHSSRGDITSSEDDNVLVHGVSTDANALGFFGFAYYSENRSKVRAVPILAKGKTDPKEAVAPTFETIENKTYKPLSRPIFIYVSTEAEKRESVRQFVDFYKNRSKKLVKEVGYVPLS